MIKSANCSRHFSSSCKIKINKKKKELKATESSSEVLAAPVPAVLALGTLCAPRSQPSECHHIRVTAVTPSLHVTAVPLPAPWLIPAPPGCLQMPLLSQSSRELSDVGSCECVFALPTASRPTSAPSRDLPRSPWGRCCAQGGDSSSCAALLE